MRSWFGLFLVRGEVDMNTWMPTPLDTLIEYLYSHRSWTSAKILWDIVGVKRLPANGVEVIEICGRHLKHLPRRSREEALDIAKRQVDQPVDSCVRANAAVYTYAAHAKHRVLREDVQECTRVYESLRDWLKSAKVDHGHVKILADRLDTSRIGLYVKEVELDDSAVFAVAVYDVMTAMDVIGEEEPLTERLLHTLRYLKTVYSVRAGRAPDAYGSEVSSYVLRRTQYKQVMVKK